MNLVICWLIRLYQLLLTAYPAGFRGEFQAEMQAAFTDQIEIIGYHQRSLLLQVILRELRTLPISIIYEYWLSISNRSKDTIMDEITGSISLSEDTKPSLENGTQPQDWKSALLAGFPHIIITVLLIVVTLTTQNRSGAPLLKIIEIATLVFTWSLVGILIIGLFIAWRKGWPRWAASYYFYAFVLAAAPLLLLTQNRGFDGYLMLFYLLALVVWIYAVTRRDAIKGLLMITPIAILSWFPLFEFIPGEFRNPIQVFMLLITALAAIVIARYGSWRIGIWTIIASSILAGIPISYYRTFYHNIPPEYADPATISMFAGRYSEAVFWSAILVIAPLLLWVFWELAKRSGFSGALGFQLLFTGLLLNFTANMVAGSVYRMGLYTTNHLLNGLFGGLIIVGASLYISGLITLLKATKTAGVITDRTTIALLIFAAIGLPLMFMFPMFDMRRYAPTDLPFGLFYENNVPDVLYYGLSTLWLLLCAYLITRLKVPPHPVPGELDPA